MNSLSRFTDIRWTVQQTLQVIVSGGLTAPETLNYFPPPGAPRDRVAGLGTGANADPEGR